MKKLGHILTAVIVLCMVVCCLSVQVFAEEATSGKCGKKATWEYDKESCTLSIYGEGYLLDNIKSSSPTPWEHLKPEIKKIVIEDGLTSVYHDGRYPFRDCPQLTEIQLPNTWSRIKNNAFANCVSLRELYIPASVGGIGDSAFVGCNALEAVWVDADNPKFLSDDSGAVYNKETLYYDEKEILYFIPATIEGEYSVPEGVTELSLKGTNPYVTVLHVPSSIHEWYGAWTRFPSLQAIYVPENTYGYSTKDGVLFNKKQTELLAFPLGKGGNYTVPHSVEEIRSFSGSLVESVVIPASVTKIYGQCFDTCDQLTDIYFGGTEEAWKKIASSKFEVWNEQFTVHYNAGCPHEKRVLPAVEATCEKSGLTEGSECILCGLVFVEQERISRLDHVYVNGECSSCGIYDENRPDVCGPRLTWRIENPGGDWLHEATGTLIISGTGEMKNYTHQTFAPGLGSGPPWDAYSEQIKEIIVEEGVTSIGSEAFGGGTEFYSWLSSVKLPKSLESIGFSAFSGLDELKTIDIPTGVTSIGDLAFSFTGITSVTIPEGVTTIGRGTFQYTPLEEIYIPASVTSIDISAFAECKHLQRFVVDENNPNYSSDSKGILYNKDKTLLIKMPVSISGRYEIPESVVKITESTFALCNQLTEVYIHKNIVSVGSQNPFGECSALQKIIVDEENEVFKSDAYGVLYSKDGKCLIAAPCGLSGTYTIADGVKELGNGAFLNCDQLKAVEIPASVKKIPTRTASGKPAFKGCDSLEHIWVDPENEAYSSDDRGVLLNKKMTDIEYMPQMLEGNYRIPPTVTGLSKLVVTKKDGTYGMPKLTSVTIPVSVKVVNTDTFRFCAAIEKIYYEGTEEQWNNIRGMEDLLAENYFEKVPVEFSVKVCHHEPEVIPAIEPTCTEAGKTEGRVCGLCGEVLKEQESVPAAGHTMENGVCTMCGTNNPFTDVLESDWFYQPVMWAVANGVTGGKTPTTFAPNEGCTRAHVVTFLWAANGKPEPVSMSNPFEDVPDDAWYAKPVLWAVENGITGGTSATTFGPEQTCTRAQIVTFLYAAAEKPEVSGGSTFKDVADADWFAKPVIWAGQNEVTGGIGDGKFGPNNTCTRGQVVTFLYKVYG